MLFTTSIFWIFFILVFLTVILNSNFIKSIKLQNIALLLSSYIFYGYWDWRFLGLIIFVTFQTFFFGACIYNTKNKKKYFLFISIFINILILCFFKYFNFFSAELANLIKLFSLKLNSSTLNIILPVGISFYIFQTLTYLIDIYKKKIVPEKSFINYATFVAFFPQLVAGPIERASNLLPQFNKVTSINSKIFYLGLKIIIFGLFLKIFIADNLASTVDDIFSNYKYYSGGSLTLGVVYFSIQIYSDFCGYSLIAIGVAKCMGFELMINFNTPYFSTSIQDFWRRWHISLSSFFKDYFYILLGGSREGKLKTSKNLIYTFTISGLWHGANWTFILWGFFHGIILILQKFISLKYYKLSKLKFLRTFFSWFITIFLVAILWIIFRSETIWDAFNYMTKIIFEFQIPTSRRSALPLVFYYLIVDLFLFKNNDLKKVLLNKSYIEIFILALMLMLVLGSNNLTQNFIYFQF